MHEERRLTERETDRAKDLTLPSLTLLSLTLLYLLYSNLHSLRSACCAALLVELRARGRWRAATAVAPITPLSTARALSMHALIRRRAARPRPARRPTAVGPALLGRRRSSAPARMRGHGHECSYAWACAQGCQLASSRHSTDQARSVGRRRRRSSTFSRSSFPTSTRIRDTSPTPLMPPVTLVATRTEPAPRRPDEPQAHPAGIETATSRFARCFHLPLGVRSRPAALLRPC